MELLVSFPQRLGKHIFMELPSAFLKLLMTTNGQKRNDVTNVECVTVQHIYCTNNAQNVQSATELYLQ